MLTLEEMQFLAKKRGGKCLTKTYARAIDKMTWKCAKGHIWEATGQSIKNQKSWCPKCCGRIHDIPFMQKLAKKRGGSCLSKKFIAVTKHLIWQCEEGHKWRATPSSIKAGTWCPKCVNNKLKHTTEYLQNYAEKYQGICTSKTYKNYRHILKWICKKGHTFNSSIENLKRRKHFCLECGDAKQKTIRRKKTTA